jgi:DNA repair protein RadA/Sms
MQSVNEVTGSAKTSAGISKGVELKPELLKNYQKELNSSRISTGLKDVDAVLGGGIVEGSIILLAGQPGIGKSTLLMQLAQAIALNSELLYVSGEESPSQVSDRNIRLHGKNDVKIVSSNSANDIAATIASGKYKAVIIDSIQTIAVDDIPSGAGSVSQVTNATHLITAAAKKTNTAVIIVGHVTKDGTIAGPKVLEHLVDVVMQLEGDRYAGFRVLRCVKNRYGSTNDTSILEMTEKGLSIVTNPSAALLSERKISDGSVVLATMEGNRPILVEIQALVNPTNYGYPKRAASGFDINRLNLLIAMLERRTTLKLSDKDIYINVVGGIKISENAADLAVCMAIASATKAKTLAEDAVVFGELGLSGEVRHVSWAEKRIFEALKLGFKLVVGPKLKKVPKGDYTYKQASDIKATLNALLVEGK